MPPSKLKEQILEALQIKRGKTNLADLSAYLDVDAKLVIRALNILYDEKKVTNSYEDGKVYWLSTRATNIDAVHRPPVASTLPPLIEKAKPMTPQPPSFPPPPSVSAVDPELEKPKPPAKIKRNEGEKITAHPYVPAVPEVSVFVHDDHIVIQANYQNPKETEACSMPKVCIAGLIEALQKATELPK